MKRKSLLFFMLLVAFVFAMPLGLSAATPIYQYDSITNDYIGQVDVITPYKCTSPSREQVYETFNTYIVNVPQTNGAKEVVLPVKISGAGCLTSDVFSIDNESGYVSSCNLYSDEACTKLVTSYGLDGDSKFNYISKAGTYYLKISAYSYSSSVTELPIGIYSNFLPISGSTKTVTSKKAVASYFANSSSSVYYKITVKKTSKLTYVAETIDGFTYDAPAGTVTLLKSDKKTALSNNVKLSKGKMIFAVPKGTYYIKATKSSAHFVKSTITAKNISDKTGTSKAKAKTVKLNGSAVSGYILPGDSTSKVDWIKFVNTKTQKVTLVVSGSYAGKIQVSYVNASHKTTEPTIVLPAGVGVSDSLRPYTTGTGGKLQKGTYYFKVKKKEKKANGVYSIKIIK